MDSTDSISKIANIVTDDFISEVFVDAVKTIEKIPARAPFILKRRLQVCSIAIMNLKKFVFEADIRNAVRLFATYLIQNNEDFSDYRGSLFIELLRTGKFDELVTLCKTCSEMVC